MLKNPTIALRLHKYKNASLLVYGVFTLVLMFPDAASALGTSNNSIETVFCNIIGLMTGGTGKAISSVGVIAFGMGALLGKTSWGTGFIMATGIALIFGASSVVNVLTGNGGASFCSGSAIGLSVNLGVPVGVTISVPVEIAIGG